MSSKAVVTQLSPKLLESLIFFNEKFNITDKSQVSEENGLKLNDATFLRYLRARNGDNEKALSLLNGTIKWRKEFGLDKLTTEWTDIIKKENATGKTYARGFDKNGHAILYMKPRHENSKVERAISIMEYNNNGVEKLVLVIDFEGYSILNAPPMKTSMATLHILQDYYPERLFRAYCVNPPWIFSAFWSAITPFIDPETKKKIVMVSGSKDHIKNELSQQINDDVLESAYGGIDSRPFDSSIFLNGPFHYDFKKILDERDGGIDKVHKDAINHETIETSLTTEDSVKCETVISADQGGVPPVSV